MRIFKLKLFARFARRENIADASLQEAVARAEPGRVDADLGGGLIKQRVARQGRGRSGGFRVLLAYRSEERTVFLYGFAKSDLDNIDPLELATLGEVSAGWLAATPTQIDEALEKGYLIEVQE